MRWDAERGQPRGKGFTGWTFRSLLLALGLAFGGCTGVDEEPAPPVEELPSVEAAASAGDAAVPATPEDDRERDAAERR